MTTASKRTNNPQKPDGRVTSLWAAGVILLMLAIGFSIGWATRGPRIHDFTGIGRAEILKITRIDQSTRERHDFRYRFDVRITAGEETFADYYNRSGRPDWHQGDILPIAYNINNPREYVIDNTPEEYIRWYNTIGVIALGLMLGAVCCFGSSSRIKRRIAQDAEIC